MTNDFSAWIAQNNLQEVFTTAAGDTLYVNRATKLGVLRKYGEARVHTFYLSDVTEFKTYDDEHLVTDWNRMTSWNILQRSTIYSSSEMYMLLRFSNQLVLKIQIFKATDRKIKRNSEYHISMFNYACRLSQVVFNCIVNL